MFKLTTFPLTLLIIGAIDSIRNLPAIALFGHSLIFLFIMAAIFFLIPSALIAADFSANALENKNGIYYWVNNGLGKRLGVLAVWLQWINTLVWFPTVIAFMVGTLAYLFSPQLLQQPLMLVLAILIIYWGVTWIGCQGLEFSSKFANCCTIIGMIVPFILLILLAAIWLLAGKPVQFVVLREGFMPNLAEINNWVAFTAVITTFLGIEIAAVHVKEVADPRRTFPKALIWAVCCIFAPMMLGALAISLIVPQAEINLVSGVMQTFANLLASFKLQLFLPVTVLMLLIGSFGNIISWLISPVKGLLQIAHDNFLPKQLASLNNHGVASRLLVIQGVLVSVLAAIFLLMPSINGAYWLLTALSTQLYLLMYLLMFVAAWITQPSAVHSSIIPCGPLGRRVVCTLGLMGCLIALIVGFIPPNTIAIGSVLRYELVFGLGLVGMMLPVLLLYKYNQINT